MAGGMDGGADGALTATVQCGPYSRRTELGGRGEREATMAAFLATTAMIDDLETDVERLEPFLMLTIEQTGQIWIYPVDVFLTNLLHRRGDQERVRRALARLAPQESEDGSEGD